MIDRGEMETSINCHCKTRRKEKVEIIGCDKSYFTILYYSFPVTCNIVVEWLKLKLVIAVAIVVTFVALKDKRSECCIV